MTSKLAPDPTDTGTDKATPRLCHIWNGHEGSYCGAKKIAGHEHEIHDKDYCKKHHQICVVCVAVFEQQYGRPW